MASAETTETAGVTHQQLMVAMNEWAADDLTPAQIGEFVCECEDRGCLETVPLPLTDYARVRSAPGRLVTSEAHDDVGGDSVRQPPISAGPGDDSADGLDWRPFSVFNAPWRSVGSARG